jgi:hypothetical protein
MIPVLLRDRVFRRYWSASTISMFGDQVSGLAPGRSARSSAGCSGRRSGWPALWVATLGGVTGFALLLPTPLPRYRLPAAPSGASRDARSGAGRT